MKLDWRFNNLDYNYTVSAKIYQNEVHTLIDKRVFDLVSERLAEDLYNKHKEYMLENVSLKSLIKATYKKSLRLLENKILQKLELTHIS